MLENYFHVTQNYYFINVDGNYDKKKKNWQNDLSF